MTPAEITVPSPMVAVVESTAAGCDHRLRPAACRDPFAQFLARLALHGDNEIERAKKGRVFETISAAQSDDRRCGRLRTIAKVEIARERRSPRRHRLGHDARQRP